MAGGCGCSAQTKQQGTEQEAGFILGFLGSGRHRASQGGDLQGGDWPVLPGFQTQK